MTSSSSGSGGDGQIPRESLSDNNAAETSATPLTNNNNSDEDSDAETDSETNAAEETKEEEAEEADVEVTEGLTGMELLPLIEELFGSFSG